MLWKLKIKTNSNGRQPQMEDNIHGKRTSNGRRPQMEDDLKLKTTYNGRQPKYSKSGISQQQLYGLWEIRCQSFYVARDENSSQHGKYASGTIKRK
jgi:hypothetical protein